MRAMPRRLPAMNLRRLVPLLLLLASASADAGATDDLVLPAGQDVAGASQSQWSRKWWQWALSFDAEDSPVADQTGAACRAGQQGPVWFLAGGVGNARLSRECTVPAGKFLFFPLANYVAMPTEGGAPTCEVMMRDARQITDGASRLVLKIDGQPQPALEAHRVDTRGCFDAGARRSPPENVFPSAGNGYYVMLKPLPPGTHEIEFGAVLPAVTQAITYRLHVR
jgi:hypothetical protein